MSTATTKNVVLAVVVSRASAIRLYGSLLLCSVMFGHRSLAGAQSTDTPTLSVGVREVFVPASVTRKSDNVTVNTKAYDTATRQWYAETLHGATKITSVSDLTAKDFHIFEDGREARISKVLPSGRLGWGVKDNVDSHCQLADYFSGIWDEPDKRDWSCGGPYLFSSTIYLIYFIPLQFENSCHKIKVEVDRPGVSVSARQEYCNASSPADPLAGSKMGKQLETDLASGRNGKISLTGQIGFLLSPTSHNTVDVALAFPWQTMKFEWDGYGQRFYAPLVVLGLAYRKDGNLAMRFSDPCLSTPGYLPEDGLLGTFIGKTPEAFWEYNLSSDRYERQLALAPGNYDLKIAMTNGDNFGRVEMPLSVPAYDPKKLWVSSIFLCKRFHKPADAPGEAEQLPVDHVPLMSQGVEFTPAGDTKFKTGDRLVLWFQIHFPPNDETTSQPLHFQLTVTNLQTGKVEANGLEDASPYKVSDSSTINIAKEIGFDKLSPGAYRVDVQALDPTGTSTVQSSTNFTVSGK